MSVISDLLRIQHFTTASGSTVRTDFLEAVGRALGIRDTSMAGILKDELLARVIETATHAPMDPALFSPGATVTNRALQTIIDGLIEHGVPGSPDTPDVERRDLAGDDVADLEFNPAEVRDERDRRLVVRAVRDGQDKFRFALVQAYGARCAITECDAVEALEAAHIFPYRGPATNRVSNGLLLRSDVHILFDRGAIAIDESCYTVLLKPHLQVTRYGTELFARRLLLPNRKADRPSTAALRAHREWAGL